METSIKKVYKLDETILIVTASTKGCAGRKYVSVTANEIQPRKASDIINDQREYLEDGEYWRMSVEAKTTTLGLDDYNEQFDDNELLEMADISLYPKTVTIDGEDYNFVSGSCGCMHDDIKKVTSVFNGLISLHLSENTKDAELIMSKIKSDDVDSKVLKFTKEFNEAAII